MALEPFTGQNMPRKFRAYDLEWNPADLKMRLAGVFDGARYRYYRTMAEFLDGELVPENAGTTWFAHAGGLYDVQYVLAEILHRGPRSGLSVEIAFSSSSAIICAVRKAHRKYVFADSYWLMHDSLKRIGASLGMQKGGNDYACVNFPACGHVPGKCIFDSPLPVLADYNELDCRILYAAIDRMQSELLDMGGALKLTVASCAMHLFRSRYLAETIQTTDRINSIARQAYVASRVEVYRKRCGEARYYDINSSFPRSMCRDLPGELCRSTPKPRAVPSGLCLVDASVRVPDCYLPPLPYRTTDRAFFPVGSWRAWFTGEDLKTLQEAGGHITALHETHEFRPFRDMAAYVSEIYGRRKRESDPFRRILWKYLLNSLYGKTSENAEKSALLLWPEKLTCQHSPSHIDSQGISQCMSMLMPGAFIREDIARLPNVHVPIAAYVTAYSRSLLYGYQKEALAKGRLYYSDTDSLVTDAELSTSTELGALKLETVIRSGVFVAPKLYRIDETVRAKGFSGMRAEEFDRLTAELDRPAHERSAFRKRRFRRLKELYRAQRIDPEEIEVSKRLVLAIEKRRPLRDGDTRPWDVREIKERYAAAEPS